jgi:hypothetical protein
VGQLVQHSSATDSRIAHCGTYQYAKELQQASSCPFRAQPALHLLVQLHTPKPYLVLLQVQDKGPANLFAECSSSLQQIHILSSSQRNSGSTSSSTSKKTSPPDLSKANFPYACKQLAAAASQDTKWHKRSHDALKRVNHQLGGFWLLVQCGTFSGEHPLAGRPARALLHVSMWCLQGPESSTVSNAAASPSSDSSSKSGSSSSTSTESSSDSRDSSDSSESSSRRPRGRPRKRQVTRKDDLELSLLKAPVKHGALPSCSKFHMHYAAYQLDADGWPTGELCSTLLGVLRRLIVC